MAIKIKWNSLLHITELEFEPEAPKMLKLSDELLQSISWLTAATRHDRKLLRCDENGAILVSDAWNGFNSVEVDELNPQSNTPDTYTATVENKGVLIATSTEIVAIGFVQISGGDTETVYVSPDTLYWYPHNVFSVTATVVPASSGSASYVGITAFN